jgi:hypothetical protein
MISSFSLLEYPFSPSFVARRNLLTDHHLKVNSSSVREDPLSLWGPPLSDGFFD